MGLKPVNERRVGGGVKQEPLEGIKLVNYMIKRIRIPPAAVPRMDCQGRSRETRKLF